MAEAEGWYWCMRHQRVEQGSQSCPPDDVMGPYESEEAAREWRQRLEARNERWDAEDRAWQGDEDE